MNNRLIFIVVLIVSFLFSLCFISAQTEKAYCVNNGMDIIYKNQPTLKQNENFTFSFHIYNSSNGQPLSNTSSFCAFHLYNSTGNHVITNNDINFGLSDYDFYEDVFGGNFSNNGEYSLVVACFDDDFTISGECSDSFIVTPTGEPTNNVQLYLRIFLLLFFMLSIFLIQWNQSRIDYDKWYNKIAEKYRTKNTFKWVLSAVGYNMFKNSYIFSYLIGLLGMLVLTELTVFFNITSVISIMDIVLGLYTWGALAVVIVFFSQVQEWIMDWKEDLEKIKWGEDFHVK